MATNHPFIINDIAVAIRVHNLPVTSQDPDRAIGAVLNANSVNKDPASLLGVAVLGSKPRGRLNHDFVRSVRLHGFQVYPEWFGWYVWR